ncbi:Uncharacterised protein [Mycobacterium tuberculosis]|nr:Uncharacterised protein [Mycobacterium tuberculosis]
MRTSSSEAAVITYTSMPFSINLLYSSAWPVKTFGGCTSEFFTTSPS